jgi:hypothetical protein
MIRRRSRRPWLIVVVDKASGLALVRGIDAGRACRLVSTVARRSVRGSGWVIPARYADDLAALGQAYHDLVIIHERKGKQSDR